MGRGSLQGEANGQGVDDHTTPWQIQADALDRAGNSPRVCPSRPSAFQAVRPRLDQRRSQVIITTTSTFCYRTNHMSRRYHVLLKYGGIYLDTDVRALHDFTPILDMFNYSFAICENPHDALRLESKLVPTQECTTMINAIIAAPPNHPAVQCAAQESMAYTRLSVTQGRLEYKLDGTGPPRWTACVKRHGLIHVLPSWTFLPCPFQNRYFCSRQDYANLPHVYGMHEWAFSWRT